MRRFLVLLLMILPMMLAGCAGRVRDTGFLPGGYESFNHLDKKKERWRMWEEEDFSLNDYFLTQAQREEYRSQGRLTPRLDDGTFNPAEAQPVLFVVERPQWRAPQGYTNTDKQDDILVVIRERLYRYLLRQYPHPVRVRYAYTPGDPMLRGYRIIEVHTAVTDIKKGNGALRYIIGYGAGAAVMQLEGRLVEDGVTIAEFAYRTAHAAYPFGFFNTSVFKSDYALKYAAEVTVGKIAGEVRDVIPAARPLPAGVEPSPIMEEMLRRLLAEEGEDPAADVREE